MHSLIGSVNDIKYKSSVNDIKYKSSVNEYSFLLTKCQVVHIGFKEPSQIASYFFQTFWDSGIRRKLDIFLINVNKSYDSKTMAVKKKKKKKKKKNTIPWVMMHYLNKKPILRN